MNAIESFAAVSAGQPLVLILGSIPGVASLQAVQYYAHPRNAFWPIMADYFSFAVDLAYEQRLACLTEKRVALWDVLQRCVRTGSLDSAIEADTIKINPIDRLIASYPSVKGILLNGGKAHQEFRKAFPELINSKTLSVQVMPSTSPAYASMSFSEKKIRWHQALAGVVEPQV